jgi:hypothetical protein
MLLVRESAGSRAAQAAQEQTESGFGVARRLPLREFGGPGSKKQIGEHLYFFIKQPFDIVYLLVDR